MSARPCQEWCPNCRHFFKDFGMNNCHLVNWAEHPHGGNYLVRRWLDWNTNEGTVIRTDANYCPGFEVIK